MKRSIGVASLIWTASILLSRVIGLVRETVLGSTLGVSPEADAYRTAFTVPDTFLYLLAGGALSIVMIPLFTAHLERGDEARGWRTFSLIANFLVLLMALLLPAVWWWMPELCAWVAPGFDAAQMALLVHLSRIVLPATAFHMLGGLLQAALLARDRHGIPALAPLVYTGAVIVGGLVGGTAEGFAWGVLVGAALGPFLLPLVACLRVGLRWQPVLSFRDADFLTWLWRSLPVMLGWSIVAMDDAVINHYGSSLAAGAVATLGYAKQLMRVPMGVFGSAMGFAAFPTLSRLCAEGRAPEAWGTIRAATRQVLVLAFGSQVVLTVAGPEVATLVYSTRRIPVERMGELGLCLGLFSLALGAWSAQGLFARGFYAKGKVWLPTWLGTGLLVAALPVYGLLAGQGAWGLALASTVGITVYVVVLAVLLQRELGGEGGLGGFTLRGLVATAVGVGAGLGLRALLPALDGSRLDAAWRAALLGGVGGLAFLGAALVLRLEGLAEALGPLLRRLPAPLRRRLPQALRGAPPAAPSGPAGAPPPAAP